MTRLKTRDMLAALLLAAAATEASAWDRLDDAGVRTALNGTRLIHDAAWQEFRASGRTLYNAGQDSWGYWEARGNQYCSQWPPADGWACYTVDRDGDRVRFTGESGTPTEGRIAPTN